LGHAACFGNAGMGRHKRVLTAYDSQRFGIMPITDG
jgi:hypothetical protein